MGSTFVPPRLTCCPSRAELVAVCRGQLPPVEQDDLARHLAECPACADALLTLPRDGTPLPTVS